MLVISKCPASFSTDKIVSGSFKVQPCSFSNPIKENKCCRLRRENDHSFSLDIPAHNDLVTDRELFKTLYKHGII